VTKARSCKSERDFRYPAAAIAEAARMLPETGRKLVVARLADRKTWKEIAEMLSTPADVPQPLGGPELFELPSSVTPMKPKRLSVGVAAAKSMFRRAVTEVIYYLDTRNGRGIIPGVGKRNKPKSQVILIPKTS
jgi:hypothetical protein